MPLVSSLPWRAGRAPLIALLAALLLAVPLLATLHAQAAERALLLALRQTLDPLAASVAVQRALLQHDDASAAVLGGDAEQETYRRVWQAEVDRTAIELDQVLQRGLWERAGAEASALRDDWQRLLGRIELRRIGVADSRAAHRLLVEQSMMVGDLATLHMAATGSAPDPDPQARTAATLARIEARALRPRAGAARAEVEIAHLALQARLLGIEGGARRVERRQAWLQAALALLALLAAVGTAALAMPLLQGARQRPRAQSTQAEVASAPLPPELCPQAAPRGDGSKAQMRSLLGRLRDAPVSPPSPPLAEDR
jgi:hypothetical protein